MGSGLHVVKPQVLGSLRLRCESGILIQKFILHPPTRGIKIFKALQSTHGEKLRSPVSLTPFRRGVTSTWDTEREGRLQGSGPGQSRWRGLGRQRSRGDQDSWVAGGTWDCRLVGLPGFREWRDCREGGGHRACGSETGACRCGRGLCAPALDPATQGLARVCGAGSAPARPRSPPRSRRAVPGRVLGRPAPI